MTYCSLSRVKMERLQKTAGILIIITLVFADSVHITLLGLAVTEFQELVNKKSSIKNFFISPKKVIQYCSVPCASRNKDILIIRTFHPLDCKPPPY